MKSTYVIFVFLLFGVDKAVSAEFNNEIIIPATIQYESNPSFLSDDEISIYKKIISPRFVSSIEDDRNRWGADLSYYVERSSNTSISEDREDATIGLSWMHDFETGNFSVNAHKEEGSTRETELSDSGLIIFDGTRISKSAQISGLKNLSEKLSVELNVNGRETNYLNIDLFDYKTKSVSGRVNYRTSETSLLFIDSGKIRYESIDNLIRSELRDYNIGLEIDLSDTTSAILSLGESDVEDIYGEKKENQGNFTLNLEKDVINIAFTVSRAISPSGEGGFIKADQFTGAARYAITETSNLGLTANIRKNIDEVENKTKLLSIFYDKQLSEKWRLIIRGSRRELESDIVDAVNNNIFSISMSYTI